MPDVTANTRWWGMIGNGQMFFGRNTEQEARKLVADWNRACPSKPFAAIQIRPVLPGDVSGLRPGLEAAQEAVKDLLLFSTIERPLVGTDEHNAVINIVLARIDKLLADNPEEDKR